VCPYYINTGMFDGVKTNFLLPILEEDYVANRVVDMPSSTTTKCATLLSLSLPHTLHSRLSSFSPTATSPNDECGVVSSTW
jgi:hypothetical protein